MLPQGVILKKEGEFLIAKGTKGEMKLKIAPGLDIKIGADNVRVEAVEKENSSEPQVGTTWSLIKNALNGVSSGFSKILEIEGVGYRAQLEGKELVLFLGYAQPVRLKLPEGVSVKVEKNVIEISGIDKDLVGRVASNIRELKKPEPYKGKGIHYRGEVIRRKVGKRAGATATTA